MFGSKKAVRGCFSLVSAAQSSDQCFSQAPPTPSQGGLGFCVPPEDPSLEACFSPSRPLPLAQIEIKGEVAGPAELQAQRVS